MSKSSIKASLSSELLSTTGNGSPPPPSPGTPPIRSAFSRRASFSGASSKNSIKYKFAEKLENVKENVEQTDTMEDLRLDVKKFMSNSRFGKYYDTFFLILSLISCVEFIHLTYLSESDSFKQERVDRERLEFLELGFAALFAWDWCLNFFMADHKMLFITSFFSMIDLFTVVPVFVTYQRKLPVVSEIHNFYGVIIYTMFALSTTRILRALRLKKKLLSISDAVQRYIVEMALSITVMILFFAAVMQFLEREYQSMDFHTWVYYIWVTISTVGYGDFSPTTNQGRIAAMAIIGFSIISIPKMTNELIEKMNLQSFYARASYSAKSRSSKHIVICGDLSSTSLKSFFDELFHEDHENKDLNAVILMPNPPSVEIVLLLHSPEFFLSLTYLEGSALVDSDLRRAKAETAVAIFILTNKFSTNPDEEDAKSILLNLSIKRYVSQFTASPQLYCMQLIRPQNRRHLPQQHDETELVVCLNEIKMGVLAKAVLYPGANTLLMNLISSFSDDPLDLDGDEDLELYDDNGNSVRPKEWIQEYQKGCDWEIYTTSLSDIFVGSKFCELSYALYEKVGVVLFALQITDLKSNVSKLLLNPANYVIPNKEDYLIEAFVIAQNQASSDLTFSNQENVHSFQRVERNITSIAGIIKSSIQDNSSVAHEEKKPHHKVVLHDDGTVDELNSEKNEKQEEKSVRKSRWKSLKKNNLLKKSIETFSFQEVLHQLQDKHLTENYYLRPFAADLNDCLVRDNVLDEYPRITNHVLILGKGIKNLVDLIKPLRAKYLGVLRYIVIVYPGDLPHDVWSRIAIFDAILVVRGSPLEERHLRRAGIFRAQQVVVLAEGGDSVSNSGMAALVDSDAIFTYQCVKRMNPNAQAVVEIVNTSNISYIDEDMNGPSDDYKFSSQFAAGTLFTTSLLDSIVCQAYYNPQIIKVVSKLISGVDSMDRTALATEAATKSGKIEEPIEETSPSKSGKEGFPARKNSLISSIKGSCLYQIALPEQFAKKNYGALFQHLVQTKGIIPLGLLRGTFENMSIGPKANKQPYVFTNPPKDTKLFSSDRVFVLSPDPIQIKLGILDWIQDKRLRSSSVEDLNLPGSPGKNGSPGNLNMNLNLDAIEKSQRKLEERFLHFTADVNDKFQQIMRHLDRTSNKNLDIQEAIQNGINSAMKDGFLSREYGESKEVYYPDEVNSETEMLSVGTPDPNLRPKPKPKPQTAPADYIPMRKSSIGFESVETQNINGPPISLAKNSSSYLRGSFNSNYNGSTRGSSRNSPSAKIAPAPAQTSTRVTSAWDNTVDSPFNEGFNG